MLDYAIDLPPGPRDGLPLIVLLHGRGSDERDLMGARSGLPPDAIVVTPRAPHAGTQWGYGGGWAWYRFLGGTAPEPQSFATSQLALTEFLEQLPAMLPVAARPPRIWGLQPAQRSTKQ